jgi:hypothetical protein
LLGEKNILIWYTKKPRKEDMATLNFAARLGFTDHGNFVDSLEAKQLFTKTLDVDGNVVIDGTITQSGNVVLTGNLTVNGNTVLGDNSGVDTVTIHATTTTIGDNSTDTMTVAATSTFSAPTVTMNNSAGSHQVFLGRDVNTSNNTLEFQTGGVSAWIIGSAGGVDSLTISNAGPSLNQNLIFALGSGVLGVTGDLTVSLPKTDYQRFLPANVFALTNVGTWTKTRIAQGNWTLRKTAADSTTNMGFDISEAIRTASNKGFRLDSIDVIYQITGAAADATPTVNLQRVVYADGAAVSLTAIPLNAASPAFSANTTANPSVANVAVTTPLFAATAQHYMFELTLDGGAATVFDIYGINLKFSRNDL